MPKTIEIDVLYGSFTISKEVPATYDEADTLLGETGGALDGFIADCTARNFLPRLYREVSKKLVELGHAREQTGEGPAKKDGTKNPVFETHIAHVERVRAAGDDALKATIGTMLTDTAAAIPYYEKGERTGFGGKVAQSALDGANRLFAQGDDKVEETIKAIEAHVPGYKVARDADQQATPESLARGISAFIKHTQEAAKKQALGMLE